MSTDAEKQFWTDVSAGALTPTEILKGVKRWGSREDMAAFIEGWHFACPVDGGAPAQDQTLRGLIHEAGQNHYREIHGAES